MPFQICNNVLDEMTVNIGKYLDVKQGIEV